MNIKYYPNKEEVTEAMKADEPLLAAISFDGKEVVVGLANDVGEHHILLMNTRYRDTDIDKFFRIAFDKIGADWTFVCPPNYKNITFENRRVEAFYKDGIDLISEFLKEIGYSVDIDIPRRYRGQLAVIGKTILYGKEIITL